MLSIILAVIIAVSSFLLPPYPHRQQYSMYLPLVVSQPLLVRVRSADTPLNFNTVSTATSTIHIDDMRIAKHVAIRFTANASGFVYYTTLTLVAPDGQRYVAVYRAGGTQRGPGFIETALYNNAPDGPVGSCHVPCTGSYSPYQAFPSNILANGDWKLEINSLANGTLYFWELSLSY